MSKNHNLKNSPITAFPEARLGWYEHYGKWVVDSNRWFLGFLIASIVCFAQMIAIYKMLPLKTVVPYVIEVNKTTGAYQASNAAAQNYVAGENEKKYFLAKWAMKILKIDKSSTEKDLISAYAQLVDQAPAEIATWIESDQPLKRLAEDQTLTRDVHIKSVTFPSAEVALVRLTTDERSGRDQKLIVKNRLITIHLKTIAPKDEDEIYINPIGLYVSHFSIVEDLS